MITVLVPLSPYRVRYTVASGRRYYDLDRLIVQAIRDREACTLGQMEELFRLPRRMLIEVLVTLLEDDAVQFQAGSVERFELTVGAVDALKDGGDLARSGFRTEDRTTTIVMERLTGGLIHRDDIAFESRHDLHKSQYWERCQALPSDHYSDDLDEGQVRPFLRPGRDKWIHRIREIEYAGGGSHWLPIDVDVERQETSGLPSSWRFRLEPVLLEFARRFPDKQTPWRFWAERTQRQADLGTGWRMDPNPMGCCSFRRPALVLATGGVGQG